MATQPPDRKPRPPAGPGKLANRTDLSSVTAVPGPSQGAYAPTGMPYGQAGQALAAQKAVPLPRANVFAPGAPAPSGAARPVLPPGGPAPNLAPGPPPYTPTAGQPSIHDLLNTPTRMPNEPVTAGLPVGPGPGPTASPSPVSKVLAYLATTPMATAQVKDLALKANQPGYHL